MKKNYSMESVTLRKFENDDILQVRGALFQEAMSRMPPFKGAEIPEDYLKGYEDDVMVLVDQGVSLIAEDTETGEIVGLVVNKAVTAEEFLNETIGLDNECKAIATDAELINVLRRGSKLLEKYPNINNLLNAIFLFVKKEHGQRGIGTSLIRRSLDVAAENGFDCVILEAGSHFTSRAAKRCGFEELYRFKLAGWGSADGTPVSKIYDLQSLDVHQDYSFCCKVVK